MTRDLVELGKRTGIVAVELELVGVPDAVNQMEGHHGDGGSLDTLAPSTARHGPYGLTLVMPRRNTNRTNPDHSTGTPQRHGQGAAHNAASRPP
jgi:hypothetical protein